MTSSLDIEISAFLQNPSSRPKVVIVTGPTASGKTAGAVEIAKRFNGEVINADSRQMYRGFNIGTAKPTSEEMANIPHHLFDVLEPDEDANVAIWRARAEPKIAEIITRKKLPVICGGTPLFIQALTKNFTIPSVLPQPEFRQQLEPESSAELWKKLARVDPAAAQKIAPQNKRLVIRALEIFEFSGRSKSELIGTTDPDYDFLLIGLTLEREKLYAKIEGRVKAMHAAGFLEEVRALIAKGISMETPAMQSHGYLQAVQFLNGMIIEAELWETMRKNTRHYAKRQLSWWRRDPRVKWFHGVILKPIDILSPCF